MEVSKEIMQNKDVIPIEFIIMYYQRQYARMEHHESQRVTLSNVIITITVLGLTFGFGDITKLNILTGICLPMVIIIANAFAIVYARGSTAICLTHQKRAHAILERYASSLYSINKEIGLPNLRFGGSLTRTLTFLHILLAAASLFPFIAYIILQIRR